MWFKWFLVGVLALAPLLTINDIGKPRKPHTNGDAVISVIVHVLVVWGIVSYWP
jgi:hypothetical protein